MGLYPRVRMLRKAKKITQAQMGEMVGVSQRVYAYYENGQRVIPPEALIILSEYHGVSVDYLLGVTDVSRPYPR